ncbi:hypothetical protein J2S74_000134 [Evansella vedderi]|uniref:Lipoprotein n=1 Tax=Evansella vedderi TaxID=38282 RepID=A0ABT9ZPX3_9BACI|nr:hypothetical protein [Evansella vedderi]MDQ0252762.1 hypothetical protein [Evansella vedderi]
MSILFVFIAACSDQGFEKEDTAAILNGEEMKYEDIMVQFSVDENREETVINYLKQEIVILEAREMGITVSDEEVEESKKAIFPGSDASERYKMIENKELYEFYEQQASLLGVSPEEFFEAWEERTYQIQAYVEKYIDAKFGYPDKGEDVDEWGQKIDDHLDKLLKNYKEDGRLIIK